MKPKDLAGICRSGNEKAADKLPQLKRVHTFARNVQMKYSVSIKMLLVVCPVYNFTEQPPSFPPGLGGSRFDLLHLDPRAIDLFDDVLNRGAPDERLGAFVPGLHKSLDRLL